MEIRTASQFNEGYVFRRPELEEALSPDYLKLLKEAGLADIDITPNLFVSKNVLREDDDVKKAVKEAEIICTYSDDGIITKISQRDAKKLIYNLGGVVLPVGIMYKLVIPKLKQAVEEGNVFARNTLEEMINTKAEWLEDLILDKTKLKIGTKERALTLPDKDGYFDKSQISELGYPTNVRNNGEFYHWHVSGNKRAAIRNGSSELGLNLSREPGVVYDILGVRFTKFFSE